jgi:hypothetical protein
MDAIKIPWWAKILVFIVRFLPLPPGLVWIKAVLPAIIAAIEALPAHERQSAREELVAAAEQARKTGDAQNLALVLRKRCTGIACPSDTIAN